MTRRHIAVIGGGWAGLAAAYRLSEHHHVTLFEAAPELGGRARAFDWTSPQSGAHRLDNGQHIMIGAYRHTLALIDALGTGSALRHGPLDLRDSRGLQLKAARLPSPLHLLLGMLAAHGLSAVEKFAMLRLMTAAQLNGFRVGPDLPVLDWLKERRQPDTLIARLWAPLCVAALNTPVAIASTRIFLNVLRDSLGGARHASDLVLPLGSLDEVLPKPMQRALEARGGVIHLRRPVRALRLKQGAVEVHTREGVDVFDGAVLATPAHQVAELLKAHLDEPFFGALARNCEAFTWQPITTCYLIYDRPVRLSAPMMALAEDPGAGAYGQWVFARGELGGRADSLAVVISAEGAHRALSHAELEKAVGRQLRDELGLTANLLDCRTVTEKRATFAAVPNLARPAATTPFAQLVLAGDYTDSDYPATLESAVMSGERAATSLLAAFSASP